MAPLLCLDASVPAEFEVPRRGAGTKTVDWKIGPVLDRWVFVDVKNRAVDLLQQLDRQRDLGKDDTDPAPTHDVGLLFRSLETKLPEAESSSCLQGVWILTQLKQESSELERTFSGLDAAKVHFAILGDFERDAHILTRQADDEQFLMNLFQITGSTRFTFKRNSTRSLAKRADSSNDQ